MPTITRAMSINLGMFTTYEEAKERLAVLMPNYPTSSWLLATFLSGAVGATMGLPFDNAKTKMQGMTPGKDGKMPYKNIFDAMFKTV